jgi:hypothetical protein
MTREQKAAIEKTMQQLEILSVGKEINQKDARRSLEDLTQQFPQQAKRAHAKSLATAEKRYRKLREQGVC